MNLYKISNTHTASNSSFSGIVEFKLSEDDEAMFEYVDKEYGSWSDLDLEPEDLEEIKDNKCDCREGSDYYYGVDRYDWECIKDDISEAEIKVLEDCGIIKKDLTLI